MRFSSALVLLALSLAASRAEAQGLGEAAERERARREALVKERGPARVLTDRDANPAGEWAGWRDWTPPDGTFTMRMPARPVQERDEAELGGSAYVVPRTYYHARDELGSEFWVSVTDLPPDYVRFEADRIWSDFPTSRLFRYTRNDVFARRESQLGGRPIRVQYGQYSQVVGCLVGLRYYELLAKAAPGDPFLRKVLHPFFLGFRP
jgi:hypothetical protein